MISALPSNRFPLGTSVEYRELAICVDIGGTNTSIGLVDANGDCATTSTMDTRATDHPSIFVRRLCREIELLREKVPSAKSFKGIGIASPAAIFHTGVIDHPANFGWGSVDIVKMMKEYYDLPVTITNDGNAAALGEMEFGIARGLRNFVEITIGTGVGSGIVVDSRLLLGGFGWGGEMGHVIVNEGGRECGCGRAGCLETYVSASGICRTAFELLAVRNTASELRNISLSKLTSEAIHHHARKGDSIALEAFNVAGGILGRFLANVAAILDPEAFILFGGVANAGDILINPVRSALEANLMKALRGRIRLMQSDLQHRHAGVMGASVLVFHPEYFPASDDGLARAIASSADAVPAK